MKKKLLITGGCGFIGTNLIKYILEHPEYSEKFEQILVYDNLTTGHFIDGLHDNRHVTFVKGDIRNTTEFNKIFDIFRPTEVLHLAGLVSIYDCNNNPQYAFDVNVGGSTSVVNKCAATKTKIIAAETSAVYEGCATPPYNETEEFPITIYSQTKVALANMIRAAHHQYKMEYNLLRFFNVAGVFQDYRRTVPALHCGFVARVILNKPVIVFGDGNRRRDFIHIDDVCKFILDKCILTNEFANRTFNVGTGTSTSLYEILELIYKHMGYPRSRWLNPIIMPEINGEAFDIYACNKEALSTGWKPEKTMNDIITDTIEYITNEIELGNIPDDFMDNIESRLAEIKIGK